MARNWIEEISCKRKQKISAFNKHISVEDLKKKNFVLKLEKKKDDQWKMMSWKAILTHREQAFCGTKAHVLMCVHEHTCGHTKYRTEYTLVT
jgi:hypothetical protein